MDIEKDQDPKHLTPLAIASEKGYLDIVKFLIKNRANVNSSLENGLTPLLYASLVGKAEVVAFLLKKGALNSETERDKYTPLSAASGGGHIDVVKELVKAGFNNNSLKTSGSTPLFYAANVNNIEVLKLLLDNGADPNEKGAKDSTPLVAAARNTNLEIATLLIEKGANEFNKAMWVCQIKKSKQFQKLLLSVFSESLDNKYIPFLVSKEIKSMKRRIQRLPTFDFYNTLLSQNRELLNKKIDIFLPPEMIAEIFKYLDIKNRIELLFLYSNRDLSENEIKQIAKNEWNRYIPINRRDENGLTMLHKLCYYGHKNKVAFLLKKGALKIWLTIKVKRPYGML